MQVREDIAQSDAPLDHEWPGQPPAAPCWSEPNLSSAAPEAPWLRHADLYEAIATLASDQRTLIRAHYWLHWSAALVARHLGLTQRDGARLHQDERGEVVWSRIPEKDWPPNPHPDRGWLLDVDEEGVIVAVHAPPPPRPRPPLVAKDA